MIKYIRIGKIITQHGIKGELKVYPTTDDIKRYDMLESIYLSDSDEANDNDIDESTYEIISVKYIKNSPIIKIKGIDSIEDAVKYIGKNIYVKKEDAIKLNANEYFISDITGLDVYEKDKKIGVVKDIMFTKVNAVLVINIDKKEKLVPFVYDFIENIDLNGKCITIKTIEGLL